jgi:hypothetical protein
LNVLAAICDDGEVYNSLFKPETIVKIMKVKVPYVDENPVLAKLLDINGCPAVYRGHAKKLCAVQIRGRPTAIWPIGSADATAPSGITAKAIRATFTGQ